MDDTATLREILRDIYQQHRRLRPEDVVEAARPAEHPLHNRFEWDDRIAGEEYRRHQAQRLIRSVRIRYADADEHRPARRVREWHSIQRTDGNAYHPVDEIVDDDMARTLLLRDMARDWKALRRRYAEFEEFVDMVLADLAEQAA